jgi:hypothetical protein
MLDNRPLITLPAVGAVCNQPGHKIGVTFKPPGDDSALRLLRGGWTLFLIRPLAMSIYFGLVIGS